MSCKDIPLDCVEIADGKVCQDKNLTSIPFTVPLPPQITRIADATPTVGIPRAVKLLGQLLKMQGLHNEDPKYMSFPHRGVGNQVSYLDPEQNSEADVQEIEQGAHIPKEKEPGSGSLQKEIIAIKEMLLSLFTMAKEQESSSKELAKTTRLCYQRDHYASKCQSAEVVSSPELGSQKDLRDPCICGSHQPNTNGLSPVARTQSTQ